MFSAIASTEHNELFFISWYKKCLFKTRSLGAHQSLISRLVGPNPRISWGGWIVVVVVISATACIAMHWLVTSEFFAYLWVLFRSLIAFARPAWPVTRSSSRGSLCSMPHNNLAHTGHTRHTRHTRPLFARQPLQLLVNTSKLSKLGAQEVSGRTLW